MKLTWFGGTALRVYIGGDIVVVDADAAPQGIDRGELLAGADKIAGPGHPPLPHTAVTTCRPRLPALGIAPLPPARVLRLRPAPLPLPAPPHTPPGVSRPHKGKPGRRVAHGGRTGLCHRNIRDEAD